MNQSRTISEASCQQQPPQQQDGPPSVAPAAAQGVSRTRLQTPAPLKGYDLLASEMSKRGQELAIFRTFSRLNFLCLMKKQAEIVTIEQELEVLRIADDTSSGQVDITNEDDVVDRFDIRDLSNSFFKLNVVGNDRCLKLIELEQKLSDYNAHLLQMWNLTQLERPNKMILSYLRGWLRDDKGGDGFLQQPERTTWSPRHPKEEFVAVQNSVIERNLLPPFVIHLWDRCIQRKLAFGKWKIADTEDSYYARKTLIGIGNYLTAIISSLLPIISILVLHFIKATLKRIFVMMGLTVLFALAILACTKASRAELFGAVVAFIAIEALFVGTAPSD